MFSFHSKEAKWLFKPQNTIVENDRVEIVTNPNTDFWQKTYYGFSHDNGHMLYITTDEKYFSFTVKAEFDYKALFDHCGVAIYQDSDNWVKAGIEYHDNHTAWLGSVVTNHGYSDWATTDIGSSVNCMWYRLSRRESDYCLENSTDGVTFHQMRIFHLFLGDGDINFGLFACSPNESTFKAIFTNIIVTDCMWEKHEA